MPDTSLLQAIKEFKDRQAKAASPSGVVLQTVSWDLDTAFVGQRINSTTVSRLSDYVDRRLEEYSNIHGSMPAIRTPQAVAGFPSVPGPDNDMPIGHVVRFSPAPCDDHVAHGRRTDQFMRFNTTGVDENDLARPTDALVGPEVQPQELKLEKTNDEVLRECVNLSREDGVPAGAVYSDNQVDYPNEQETEDGCGADRMDPDGMEIGRPRGECAGISVRRLQDTTIESFRLITPDVRIPLFRPIEDMKRLDRVTRHQDTGDEWAGGLFQDDSYDRSWMNGGDLDALVGSQGLLPGVRNRILDTFLRQPPENDVVIPPREGILRTPDLREIRTSDMREISNSIPLEQDVLELKDNSLARPARVKPLHVTLNPARTPWPWPRNRIADTTTYVTSYDIDHASLKITARVITVPSSMKIEQDVWFDLCSEPRNLREVIRTTMKSNLTIRVKERRSDGWRRDGGETEELSLCTLREMITEEEFKRYLKYGFVTVRGQSGDVYQVFRSNHHTKVWRGNKVVEEVCIRISSEVGVPPTDNVIAFMTMISADEEAFKKAGNRYKMVGAA